MMEMYILYPGASVQTWEPLVATSTSWQTHLTCGCVNTVKQLLKDVVKLWVQLLSVWAIVQYLPHSV